MSIILFGFSFAAYLPQPIPMFMKPESSILLNKSTGSSRELSFYLSTSNPLDTNSSIIQGPYSPENATDTSFWENIKEMVGTVGIRDWIIASLTGILLVIFTVIGVKKCTKKKYVNQIINFL